MKDAWLFLQVSMGQNLKVLHNMSNIYNSEHLIHNMFHNTFIDRHTHI